MMYAIAAPVYDPNGDITFKADIGSVLEPFRRRVSKRATLNLGVFVDDLGYVDEDRNMVITAKMSPSEYGVLFNMFRNYSSLFLSTANGFYLCVIESMSSAEVVEIKIMLKDKL